MTTSLGVYALPPLVCEKESAHTWPDGEADDAADEDCQFCSALMLYLAVHPGAAPATLSTAELIRHAAGLHPLGGASPTDALRGLKAKFGFAPDQPSIADLWATLAPGHAASVGGKPSQTSSTSPFRKFLPTYTGGHCVFVERRDATDRVWLIDPEATPGDTGRWASKADLLAFSANHNQTFLSAAVHISYPTKKVLCAGGYLRTEPKATAPQKKAIVAGMTVTAVARVPGGSWTIKCGTTATAGSGWYKISAIDGKSVKSLYGVDFLYGAMGRFA